MSQRTILKPQLLGHSDKLVVILQNMLSSWLKLMSHRVSLLSTCSKKAQKTSKINLRNHSSTSFRCVPTSLLLNPSCNLLQITFSLTYALNSQKYFHPTWKPRGLSSSLVDSRRYKKFRLSREANCGSTLMRSMPTTHKI